MKLMPAGHVFEEHNFGFRSRPPQLHRQAFLREGGRASLGSLSPVVLVVGPLTMERRKGQMPVRRLARRIVEEVGERMLIPSGGIT
mmetsp:Transcript_25760/g.59567  ORF Transcript_25760/g.59567 Transcript_25760/m.59567 type:complete len:86 (-) Transcript_25760:65-322(-)